MQQAVFVSATPADYERQHAGQVVEQLVRPTGLVDPAVEMRPAAHKIEFRTSMRYDGLRCVSRDVPG